MSPRVEGDHEVDPQRQRGRSSWR